MIKVGATRIASVVYLVVAFWSDKGVAR